MIDLNKKLKELKNKAKELMKLGEIASYLNTLSEITTVQLQLQKIGK